MDYVLRPEPDELDRLVAFAEREAPQVELTARLVGLEAGGSAVDVGCGPLGALATLSRLVGPSGRVVGVDASEAALGKAEAIARRLGLTNVSLVRADLHELDGRLGGFDLVYCRLVLLHQRDPAAALAAIAGLARAGGFLAYQDIVDDPAYPACDPPLPAMSEAWRLILALFRAEGLPADVARRHATLVRPGWRLVSQRGKFAVLPARDGFQIIQQLLTGARQRLQERGLASAAEVDALQRDLEDARAGVYRHWFGPLAVETVVQLQSGP
jgi:SAM-dependent methyltransferase